MSAPIAKRLPPNPRRNKVALAHRKRVVAACNHCNVRRVKCSGDTPCVQCAKLNRECVYPASVDKITISKSELDHLKQKCASLETQLQKAGLLQPPTKAVAPPPPHSDTSLGPETLVPAGPKLKTPEQHEDDEPPPTQGRLLRDIEGNTRYLGETSGATFIDALKHFMVTAIPLAFSTTTPTCLTGSAFLDSVGQYQTSDSRPLLLPTVDPLFLPPRAEMENLLSILGYFVENGNGTFPSGGTCFWGGLARDIPESGLTVPTQSDQHVGDTSRRSLAFYQTAFALASLVSRTGAGSKQDDTAADAFLARARKLLGNPLDTTLWSPKDIPTLGLMAIYFCESNRRDATYMIISIAMHIAIIHGMHKGWSMDEGGKRIFWTLFTIDRWTSLALGRPPTLRDEDVTLDLPQECPGLPSPEALRANVLLCRIAGFISANSYRLTPRRFRPGSSISYLDQSLDMLADWYSNLPPVLKLGADQMSHDRAAICLHLSYNQTIILTIRPVLLVAVKKSVADQFTSREWNIEEHPQVHRIRQCSDAARRNLRLGRWLHEISPAHKLLLPELHYIFNSAAIIILQKILFADRLANETSDIDFALEALEQEASRGVAYAVLSSEILKDLLALVHRLRSLAFDSLQVNNGSLPSPPRQQIPLSPAPDGPMMSGADSQPDLHSAHGDDVFQVLETWLHDDDMQLYNSFLT